MSKVEQFLTAAEETEIIEAIRLAEKNTSGEIRVHIEKKCPKDKPFDRSVEVFHLLKMNQTKLRNGVLFYVAVTDKKFVICGDEGIDKVVPKNFWESTKDVVTGFFKEGQYQAGLVAGIHEAGVQLKTHFHYLEDDKNELSDSISKG
ncbi:MAG: hypothetical protein CO119_09395 [Flavobacteriales bacterium CG_4_9_14_3_um_filter_40_17]|nr:MAG: hypothetical protein CO119_09395 [Flavobacteriales bacterium CG_4_9_14_3_um_filter_40_17]